LLKFLSRALPQSRRSSRLVAMSQADRTSHAPIEPERARTRRVLVCDETEAGAAFATQLVKAGYETMLASADDAPHAVADFRPQVVVVEARGGARAGESLKLARRLRVAAAAQLPLVIAFHGAGEAARDNAREIGADDCFALSTPTPEALARLDALFWRVEAGRDLSSLSAAHAALERRAEIEGFMQLLDAARAEIDAGSAGALALISSVAPDGQAHDDANALRGDADASRGNANALRGDENALREAHEFFRRNLRRADAVAFYGPDLLLAHLPRRRSDAAREDLARLHAEFNAMHGRARIVVGVARFPEEGEDIEKLIERAEVALEAARGRGAQSHLSARGARARHDDNERNDTRDDAHDKIRDDARINDAGIDDDGDGNRLLVTGAFRIEESRAVTFAFDGDEGGARAPESDGGGTMRPAQTLTSEEADAHAASPPGRGGEASSQGAQRALRESRRGEAFETSVLPAQGVAESVGSGVLARSAAEAAARERERRSGGALMPRRILLTISDPARMAQINLLLRSASYEVRAAFDGRQVLDLLRIERADLLLLDLELKHLDGLEVLRGLNERHQGRLPLPVLLLHPQTREGVLAREEARTLGASGFAALPYDPFELLEAVRETGSTD
jgi:DNA-binding response OmpR family regulator